MKYYSPEVKRYNDKLKKLDNFFWPRIKSNLERWARRELLKKIIELYIFDYNFYKKGCENPNSDLMQRAILSRLKDYKDDLENMDSNKYHKHTLKAINDLDKILEKNEIRLVDYLYFLR